MRMKNNKKILLLTYNQQQKLVKQIRTTSLIRTFHCHILLAKLFLTVAVDRLAFMKNLGTSLVTPHLERRYAIPQLSHELKNLMGRTLGKDKATELDQPRPGIKKIETLKNCYMCFK